MDQIQKTIQKIITGNTRTERKSDSSGNIWATYSLFGLTLRSDFKLAKRVALPGKGKPDVTFTRELVDSLTVDRCQGIAPSFISPFKSGNGKSMLLAFQQPACDILHFPDTAEFYLTADQILCYQLHQTKDYEIERWLAGTVLALWLERKGLPVLHASSVVIEDKVVAFLASNFAGKSSLATFLVQLGYPLLTDDALVLECGENHCVGRPGYPRIRLWPDQAKHFLGYYEDLELIHPDSSKRNVPVGPSGIGVFHDKSTSVGCIYIPKRTDSQEKRGTVEILSVSPRDAFMELVRSSFVTRILSKFGLEEERMQLLMEIVTQVPIRRLQYPSGLEFLPRVCETVVEDATSLSKDPGNGKRDFIVKI